MVFLGDTKVGCRVSSGRAGADEDRDAEEIPGSEGSEGGPALDYIFFCFFLCSFRLSFFIFFLYLETWGGGRWGGLAGGDPR